MDTSSERPRFRFRNVVVGKSYKEFFLAAFHHDLLTLASSIAFTTALALAPFVIIVLSILTLLNPASQEMVIEEVMFLLGPQVSAGLDAVVRYAEYETRFRGLSGIISFLILTISASAIFAQLKTSFNKIDEDPFAERVPFGFWDYLKDRLLSIGLVFGFIFLLIISLIVSTAIAAIFSGRTGWLWQIISLISNFFVFTGLFSAIFRFVPSHHLPWRRCIHPAVVAAIFFLVGKELISLYLTKSALASAYGAAASLVVFLIWVYYTSLTLLLSYEYGKTVLHPNELKSRFS